MILPIQQARAAAQGRITVAFIPIGRSKTVKRAKGRPAYESQPWTPKVGEPDVIRARGWDDSAYVEITAAEKTTMRWVLDPTPHTIKLARAAGFKTRAELADSWMRHHDRHWPRLEAALCPKCNGWGSVNDEPCEHEGCDVGEVMVPATVEDSEILLRFEGFADTNVYAVTFHAIADDRPRFLSRAARPRGDDLGYTLAADPLDAGPTVPEAFQRKISKEPSERDQKLREARRDEAHRTGDFTALDGDREERRHAHSADRARKYRPAA